MDVDVLSWREQQADGVSVLILRGELDHWSGAGLELHLIGLTAAGHDRIVLDATELCFCDAGGLGILLRGLARARAQQGWLRLAGADRRIRRLLTLVNLGGALPVFDSVGDAVAGRPSAR